MSQRHWLAALALGIALSSALLPPHEGWAEEQDRHQGIEINVPFPPFRFSYSPVEADRTEQPCKQGEDDRSSDLCAQWKAADAAKESADWTRRTFFLGVVGAVLGLFTLIAAGAAAFYAMRAAVATERTVDETKRIGEAQVMASLSCTSATYELIKEGFTATIEIENTGQSPASNVFIVGTLTIHEVGGPPAHSRVLAWANSEERREPCQPVAALRRTSESITFFDLHFPIGPPLNEWLTEESRNAIVEYGNSLWFNLKICWTDVFGRTHEMPIDLEGIIGPSPYNPRKKRTKRGKLVLRMADARPQQPHQQD